MGQFKKSSNLTGKIKGLMIHEGIFMNADTGEKLDLASMLERVYGQDTEFDMATSLKTDEDIDV